MTAKVLETKSLTKKFGGLVAVNHVDFSIEKKEAVGIIGPNGSGKTTFFDLITGNHEPTEGSVYFRGGDVTSLTPEKRVEKGMSRSFQLVSVMENLKVWENLVLSTLKTSKETKSFLSFMLRKRDSSVIYDRCIEALKKMEYAELDKIKEHETSVLSYGAKRMLEIAIASSLEPELLLLDEPFAGLSDEEIEELFHLLNEIRGEITFIIVEHKVSYLPRLVDRLIVLNEGRKICEGDPEEVMDDKKVRECYFGKEDADKAS